MFASSCFCNLLIYLLFFVLQEQEFLMERRTELEKYLRTVVELELWLQKKRQGFALPRLLARFLDFHQYVSALFLILVVKSWQVAVDNKRLYALCRGGKKNRNAMRILTMMMPFSACNSDKTREEINVISARSTNNNQ